MNSFWLGIFFLVWKPITGLDWSWIQFFFWCSAVHFRAALQAMTRVEHLQSLQQNRKSICKLIITRITVWIQLTQFVLAAMMKKIHSMSKGKITVNNFWFIPSVRVFFRLRVDPLHQMFFITFIFLQKAWQIQKASCPRGQHASYTNLYPSSGGLQNGFKQFKEILHFFFLCKDQWCHLHPCSQWPGDWLPVVCPLFPPKPSLAPRLCIILPPNQQEMLLEAKLWRRRICDLSVDSSWYPAPGSRLKTQQLHLLWHYCCSACTLQAAPE